MRVAAELLRRGYDARVFTRAPATPNPEAPDVSVQAVPARGPRATARDIADAIVGWNADDVWIQYVSQMFRAWRFGSAAVPLLARRVRSAGARVLTVGHELFVPWSPRPDLAAASALQRLQFRALIGATDGLVVTTASRLAIAKRFPRAHRVPEFARVVPVGATAHPVFPGSRAGPFRLGVFSPLGSGRRFDVVLDAFAKIARDVPDACLEVIGTLGDDRAERTFRRRIAAHALADRIDLTGRVPLIQVARRVAALDVFLFPMNTGATTRSSTLPLALGSGIPVVAIRGAETADFFVDGQNVAFAEALEGSAFARAVLRLRADPSLHARIAAGARALYLRRLTWPTIVDGLLGDDRSRSEPGAP
jgi:glycosyltransferase involved in cell wall biosynthesis